MRYDPDFGFLDKRHKEGVPLPAWAPVFVANLPLPLFFGAIVTTDVAKMGMLLGIVGLFLAGRRACFAYREAMLTVTYGGWIVAVFQLAPLAQFTAGFIGLSLAAETGLSANRDFGPVNTVLGGFLATVVTGGLLIVVAAAMGLVTRGLMRLLRLKEYEAARKQSG